MERLNTPAVLTTRSKYADTGLSLEEIEKQLQEYPGVKDAVVVADRHESGDASINAYLVNRTQLSAEDVKAHLKKQLPAYMVPQTFTFLDEPSFNDERESQ